ncbi:MAG: cation diffusion facilitator family transporter [Bacteroidales bacterium]|jgi:cation diffusion facilitator family transporter|nr:cation diffusion facilitator family transporter [Bacteroidales bacterium]NLM92541.1 cation transporter [Bacteroidales bacterium]
MKQQRQIEANRITWIGFFSNLALTAFKLVAGVLGHSGAMIADAIHSVSDFATDLVVVGSLKVASRPRDGNHKYGHGKVETLATALVGMVLAVVGLGILFNGGKNVYVHFRIQPLESPGMIALLAAIVSILIKEVLYRYTILVGKRINSQVVIANAWHHRSDAYSSVGTVLGISGAIFLGPRWVILDPIAAMVVSFFILRVAFNISRESLAELIETSLPGQQEQEILELAAGIRGVFNPHDLKTRKIGSDIAIDLHINVKRELNVEEAHDITDELEECLRQKYGPDTHISVHAEPLIDLGENNQ